MSADTITLMRARGGRRLAKTICADGSIADYDRAFLYDLAAHPVADLDDIARLLRRLLPRPDLCAVFGGIADPARTRGVRRLAYPDPDTGDQPTLRAAPHRWVALDLDGIGRPDTVPAADLTACAALAIERLPTEFRGVRCIVQATSGHGIKPGCRLRLWYWLSRLTTGDELGYWLKDHPADCCTFRPAQPIYTAAPVFAGRVDHLPVRTAEIPGPLHVKVPAPEMLRPPPREPQPCRRRQPADESEIERIINATLDRLRAAPDGGKHYALRSAARLLGGVQGQARFADAEAVRWLLDALPATARDMRRAARTARWGLDVGRRAPIEIPAHSPQPPDPRRKATAKTAFRLLHIGVPSVAVLDALHAQNSRRADPLPMQVIEDTAIWAALRQGQHHAR